MKKYLITITVALFSVPAFAGAYTVESSSSATTGGISVTSGEVVTTNSSDASSEVHTVIKADNGGGVVDVQITTTQDGVTQTENTHYDIPASSSVQIVSGTTSVSSGKKSGTASKAKAKVKSVSSSASTTVSTTTAGTTTAAKGAKSLVRWFKYAPESFISFFHRFFFSTVEAAEDTVVNRIPGQYIVVLKDSVENVDSAELDIMTRSRGERLNSYRSALRGFSARLSDEALAAVKNDSRVAYVSEDHIVSIADARADRVGRAVSAMRMGEADRWEAAAAREGRGRTPVPTPSPTTPPPPSSTQVLPTGIDRINAENKINKGAGQVVAVIDTGVDVNHPDLKANMYGGRNCTSSNTSAYGDDNGHGTHVAGTIAAIHNTFGVVGVAPNAKIAAIRVLDRNGNGSWSTVICGLDTVAANGPANGGAITVANMSLGGGGVSDNNCGLSNNDPLHQAICRVRDAGVTLIIAAGNNGIDANFSVPASYNDAVITVAALVDTDGVGGGFGAGTSYGADDTFANFSNFGTPVDIGAPGANIFSTARGGGYTTMSGTSMAAPHVAGAAALYLATHPGATWTTVRSALISAAEAISAGHSDPSGRHPEPVLRADTF